MTLPHYAQSDLIKTVKQALAEDIGEGDITAALIPADTLAQAKVITREHATACGQAWVNEVFKQLDPSVSINWHVEDGQRVKPDQTLFTLKGKARSLLTGERAALNFYQTLSGTATLCHEYANIVKGTNVKLLDTRKTIPGLRNAQKYAVTCGGCHNHRIGLYDAFLIKENHIAACGGITEAIHTARKLKPNKPIEVEVENMQELDAALNAQANTVMLDNFTLQDMHLAVEKAQHTTTKLEASGNITNERLLKIAQTGVDYISIGALTKHCKAVDLSMRLIQQTTY